MLLDTVTVKLRYEKIISTLIRCEELGLATSVHKTIANTPDQTNEVIEKLQQESPAKKLQRKAKSAKKVIFPRNKSSDA